LASVQDAAAGMVRPTGQPFELLAETSALVVQASDPLWLSAIRGRIMAAMASGTSLWISGTVLIDQVKAIHNVGLHPETAALLLTQADSVMSAGAALAVAAVSLIGLIAAVGSKLREWAAAAGIGRP
jgi:hypothetical protein